MNRRKFLTLMGAAGVGAATARIWKPKTAFAQTAARGEVKHLLYIHLTGGFRFTAAFNGDVDSQFNPFGLAGNIPSGTEWGPSKLLERAGWLGTDQQNSGMKSVVEIANQIAVAPCVDHDPLAGGADGNHDSGLQRFLTGSPGGPASFFTLINYGLRNKVAQGMGNGQVILPSFSFGSGGMATGSGQFAPYRPPVLQGDGFESFGFNSAGLPTWADGLVDETDNAFRDSQNGNHYAKIDAYLQSREATEQFAAIFNDPLLKVGQGGSDEVDGISNDELLQMFGEGRTARDAAIAMRLFHFGAPAAFIRHGSYDFHSDEDDKLPDRVEELNRIISATEASLKRMTHPSGGTYWDHTLVVLGSEFGRTGRGSKYNSARGSDHNNDLATRWMSMPMFGGVVSNAGIGGKRFGLTRKTDLEADGPVYSYRAMLKTMMDLLECDHSDIFPGDAPITDFFG